MCHRREREEQVFRQLRAARCPIEVEPAREELTVVQKSEAYIIDVGNDYAAILLYVGLARNLPGNTVVAEFGDLSLPWDRVSPTWLDPIPDSSPAVVYKLLNGDTFERRKVLNDRLESGLTLRRGQPLEGWVLGHMKLAIPQKFKTGAIVEAQFSVLDFTGREYCGDIRFRIDREQGPAIRSTARRGAGLYEPYERPGELTEELPVSTPKEFSNDFGSLSYYERDSDFRSSGSTGFSSKQ